MAFTKNRSKIWTDGISVFFVITVFMLPNHAWGAFASEFSLTVGDGYSDNIFLPSKKNMTLPQSLSLRCCFFTPPKVS
jgi:hypothetical protein